MKKLEKLEKYNVKNFKIPKLLDELGNDYFENCLKTYKIVLNKIKDTK